MSARGKNDGDPSQMTDEELAQATSDAAVKAGAVVRLQLNAWPVDRFEHGVEGVDPLTSHAPTDVPADKEDAVRAAARTAGLSIRKVSE
jgi:hypothetical protein